MEKEQELPYDKFLALGAEHLTQTELLAIIIRTGTKGCSAMELARKILNLSKQHTGLLGLHHITIQELLKIKGIGQVKAVKIMCIAELAKRLAIAKAEKTVQFDTPSTIADYYMEQLRHQETERIILIMVDGKNQRIDDCVLSTGTVNASMLSTREALKKAIKANAVYIILLHNHPSGDATPSKQDRAITAKMKEAAALMDIPLLDHIIIGDNNYISFRENGFL